MSNKAMLFKLMCMTFFYLMIHLYLPTQQTIQKASYTLATSNAVTIRRSYLRRARRTCQVGFPLNARV